MTTEHENARAAFEALSTRGQESFLRAAKDTLVELSARRDEAFEKWPVYQNAVAISGYLSSHAYGREWQHFDRKINDILTIYPELRNDH